MQHDVGSLQHPRAPSCRRGAIGGDSGGGVATVVDQTISSHPVHEVVDWWDRGGRWNAEEMVAGKRGGSHGTRKVQERAGRLDITTNHRP